MAVPKYDEMYNEFLEILEDRQIHEIQEIRNKVAKKMNLTEDDLLELLDSGKKKQPFTFLENLSVKLMVKMGYGNKENDSTTRPVNDGGIDGVVFEDELGINKILIQAKLYTKKGEKVSRPDMQKFKGAIEDYGAKEGVFITTSEFSPKALESANKSNIITIDGEKLVKLMRKYNVGCYIDNVYEIKKLDLDFFEND